MAAGLWALPPSPPVPGREGVALQWRHCECMRACVSPCVCSCAWKAAAAAAPVKAISIGPWAWVGSRLSFLLFAILSPLGAAIRPAHRPSMPPCRPRAAPLPRASGGPTVRSPWPPWPPALRSPAVRRSGKAGAAGCGRVRGAATRLPGGAVRWRWPCPAAWTRRSRAGGGGDAGGRAG